MNKKQLSALLLRYLPITAGLLVLLLLTGVAMWYFLRGYTFANPLFLYLIPVLIIILLAAGIVKHIYKPVLNYPMPAQCAIKTGFWALFTQWLPFALICFALLLCMVALARPQTKGRQTLPPAQGIDIMLTVDVSPSMLAKDLKPDRIAAAKEAADDFVKQRVNDRIGIVVFEDSAMLQCPLTLDYFAVFDYIKLVRAGMLKGQGTAVGDAIAVSANHLKDSLAKSKIIILLTDGESNSGAVDPLAAAKAAAAYKIKVYPIAVSGDGNTSVPVNTLFGVKNVGVPSISDAAIAVLKEIAATTGGEFYRARNNLELKQIYETINKLEKTEFENIIKIDYDDRYEPFLYAAVLLLLLSLFLDKFVFIKIP